MRPRRESRAAARLDGSVRSIRSGDVRYPGVDLPPTVPPAAPDGPAPAGEPGRLAPALDTGIAIETRTGRRERSEAQQRRLVLIGVVAAFGVLLLAGIGWRWASDRTVAASRGALEASEDSAVAAPRSSGGIASAGTADSGLVAAKSLHAGPTPIFARRGTLMLHLPVPVSKLTEIGFHQASYAYALPMKTPMKDANLTLAHKNRGTGRVASKQPTGDHYMTGEVIRMWRARPGRPDTAADVGALPGTTVLSPVNGTIVKIKPYLLYGKYPDYEVHIAPDNTHGIDLVMIHLKDLDARVGMRVVAGVTPIAKIRRFSDKFHDQLEDYTKDGGDHVHIQVNDATYPGYKGLQGAVEPSNGDATSGD